MQLADAYRHARRSTSVLCAIGLAWSAAQFDLKLLSLGPAVSVDLFNTSVPLLLACGIVYSMARCTIEFAMQPDNVRRWRLAQTDFKITVFLVRSALLMLAAGGLYRSVETAAYMAVATLLLLGISMLLIFAGTMLLMPLRMAIRSRQGRISAASSVFEAMAYSELIIVGLLSALFVALGVASLRYEPLRSMWTVLPSQTAVTIFVVAAIVVVISIYFQRIWYMKLFAYQAPFTTTQLADGTIGVSFHEGMKGVQPTQDQSSTRGRSVDPQEQ